MTNHTKTHSKFRRFLQFTKLILGLVLLVLEIIKKLSEWLKVL